MALTILKLEAPAPAPSAAPARVASGRPRPRASSSSQAASTGRRAAGWIAPSMGPNDIAIGDLERIRDRSRHAERNSPYGGNAIDSLVANYIGTGIKPVSLHEDAAVRAAIHKAWRRYTDRSDFDGRTDYYGLQSQAFRSMVQDGEVLARYRFQTKGMAALQLELLEADHLQLDLSLAGGRDIQDGNRVVCGIEIDGDGRRQAYHILKTHPAESMSVSRGGYGETVRIPADEMLHVFHGVRPKQLRGFPWLRRVLWKLNELEKYDDAELARKGLASALTGFIVGSPLDGEPAVGDPVAGAVNSPGSETVNVEPGVFQELNPGESVEIAETADVGGMYEKYMQQQLRAVAAGCGITYEQLTGDLTGVNYSSIRAGLLEFRRRCEQIQYSCFVHQFCRPHFEEWMRWAVISGELVLPNFSKNAADYLDVKWMTQGWKWVDPVKDTTAAVLQIKSGLTSRTAVVSESGEDIEQIDAENAEDMRRQRALGLEYGEKQEAAKAPAGKKAQAGGLGSLSLEEEVIVQ